jgi:hypothetical protein
MLGEISMSITQTPVGIKKRKVSKKTIKKSINIMETLSCDK